MPHKPVPRLKGFSYTGLYHYSLTICVDRRRQVFVNKAAVDLVVVQLLHTSERFGFAVIAYCLPDHLHLPPVKAARYLLANPVRAGLVERPEDYPFLGSATMSVRDLLYSVAQG